jgi:hypothetical protein
MAMAQSFEVMHNKFKAESTSQKENTTPTILLYMT